MAEAKIGDGKRARRRSFARGVGALAVALLVAGVLLGQGTGVAYDVGQVAVAAVWLALGHNPLDRG